MSKKEIVKRFLFFAIGLWISSSGISFATKAGLGVSPISCLPYVLSVGFPLTMGTFTFMWNMLFVFGQMLVLGKDYNKIQLLQIPVLIFFGSFIDLSYAMLSVFKLTNYYEKMIFMLIGCIVLALGISMQVTANVVIMSGEGLIKAIADKFHKEFGSVKVCFDTTMVIIAGIVSFAIFHKVIGVREGTVIAALSVGWIVRFFNKQLAYVNRRFLMDQSEKE